MSRINFENYLRICGSSCRLWSRHIPVRVLIAIVGLQWFACLAHAGIIDFGSNPINFVPPHVASGDGSISSFGPTLVPLSDGFDVTDIGYAVTANSISEITGGFSADRDFTLSVDPILKFQQKGETTVTQTGAGSTVDLYIDSLIANVIVDSRKVATVVGVANGQTITWDYTFTKDLAPGAYKLRSDPRYDFKPGVPGNTVTVDSLYETTISVPEPSSLALAALGFVGLAAWGWRRRKC